MTDKTEAPLMPTPKELMQSPVVVREWAMWASVEIQEQAKELKRLHDELTCEFCEKEAGPENPCVCLDCHGKG